MPDLRGVIFDLDGCLVDSEPLSLEAIATEMRALGIDDATPQELGDKCLGHLSGRERAIQSQDKEERISIMPNVPR